MKDLTERHASVTSTMDVAKERARQGAPEWTTIVAETQTAGRGRQGHDWFSPSKGGLYVTVILRPEGRDGVETLSLVAGAATAAACEKMKVEGVGLEWPNDVMVDGRKLAGILLEAEGLDGEAPVVFAGIGVNLCRRAEVDLPADIAELYVGLDDLAAQPGQGEALLAHLSIELRSRYDTWLERGIAPTLEELERWDLLRGKTVTGVGPNGEVQGRGAGFDESGGLRVETGNGITVLRAGEVRLV